MRTTRIQQAKQQSSNLKSIKNTMKFQFDDDQEPTTQTITIKDLCQEDKAKIGDLIKKLAQEQEENKKLQQIVQQKEEECKRQVKKFKQLSDSAKKEQRETEEKFKESLEVIRKLQQQEQLIHEQMLQARVSKFDSFTQCDQPLEQKENQKSNSNFQQSKITIPEPKSQITQLKAEIEEIANSLKQIQFESSGNVELSPLRIQKSREQPIQIERPIERQLFKQEKSLIKPNVPKVPCKNVINCEVQTTERINKFDSADKQIQTEQLQIDEIIKRNVKENIQINTSQQVINKNNQSVKFSEEFKQFENKLKLNQSQYQVSKEVSMQSESFQQIQESSDDEEEINIAKELLKRKNLRIQQQPSQQNHQYTVQSNPYQQSSNRSNRSSQKMEQQGYQQKHYPTYQTSNLLQSNQFKTNTLSFNLTNNEYTPQQSIQKEQFGSSILQTPQQLEMHQSEEIDSVITSLNGRSFNKPNVLVRDDLQKYDEMSNDDCSSNSSIPKEEYQKLIDKYIRNNDDDEL